MLKDDVVRSIVAAVLERAGTLGLDAAGGFLGPAWPFVKPVLTEVLKTASKGAAALYTHPAEQAAKAAAALAADQARMQQIAAVLDQHGVTAEWSKAMLTQLDRLSDDMVEALARFGQVEQRLDLLLTQARQQAARAPGRLSVRGESLEYVDFLRVPDDFLPGEELAPDSWQHGATADRHVPAGFLVWNLLVANWEAEAVAVSAIELRVDDERELPADARAGEFKPSLEPFEDHARLQDGQPRHRLFVGRRFQYRQDDFDAFRVLVSYTRPGAPRLQRLRLHIAWSSSDGEHHSWGPALYLASMPAPQLQLAGAKFGLRNAPVP